MQTPKHGLKAAPFASYESRLGAAQEREPMMNRRVALGMLVAAGVTSTGMAAPKKKQKLHHNGQSFLGDKIKQNGKHKIHKAGKSDVFAEVNNGKVVNVSASGMQVKKVKSKRK